MWLLYALLTAVFYGIFDVTMNLVSGKIHGGLLGIIVNVVAILIFILWIAVSKATGHPINYDQSGLKYALLAGVLIGLLTITFLKVFTAGAAVPLAVTLVRVGSVIVATVIAVGFLGGSLSTRQLIGLITALLGISLVIL